MQQFQRITIDPEMMSGKPCIRGMRVTVGMIVEALSAGRTIEQLLADFPYIGEPGIRQALAFVDRKFTNDARFEVHSVGTRCVADHPGRVAFAGPGCGAPTTR